VPSRRIRDALPEEIVDKIRSSSKRAKTIAIIEPVHNKAHNASFPTTGQQAAVTPATSTIGVTKMSGGITSRFSQAGAALGRGRLRQQIGLPAVTATPASQITLDHDYCTSARNRRTSASISGAKPAASATYPRPVAANTPPSMRLLPVAAQNSPFKQRMQTPNNPPRAAVIRVTGANPGSIALPRSAPTTAVSVTSPTNTGGSGTVVVALARSTTKDPAHEQAQGSLPTEPLPQSELHQPASPRLPPSTLIIRERSEEGEERVVEPQQECIGDRGRRDSDHKKDSGLESGDVSDASLNEDERGYSKLPPYLTTSKATSNRGTLDNVDGSLYDRLPAYVTGIKRSNSDKNVPEDAPRKRSLRSRKASSSSGSAPASSDSSSESNLAADHHEVKKKRSPRRSGAKDNSPTTAENRAVTRSSAAKRRREDESEPNVATSSPGKRRRRRGASPTSATSSRTSTPRKSRRRQPSASSTSSSSVAGSPPPPLVRGQLGSPRRSLRRMGVSSALVSPDSFNADRQRREQERRQMQQEKHRQVDERRILYVGKITEGTTRADLRKRFEVFGPIEEISVHFRDRG